VVVVMVLLKVFRSSAEDDLVRLCGAVFDESRRFRVR